MFFLALLRGFTKGRTPGKLTGCSVDNLYSTVAVPCYFSEANSLIKKFNKLISTRRKHNFVSYSTCYLLCAFKLQSKLVQGCIMLCQRKDSEEVGVSSGKHFELRYVEGVQFFV